ncbi:hypothetical protein HWC21_gp173 [Vibrio phage VAP7]|uniref:RNA polymerase sigma factor n=2 Tax=Vapseptimavirus VAP7 TaxID=2841303 RepID=A0A4Y5TWE0_9CAUD|nr:hypothetical protein HWC21_gp173 [Vibrio phage VAP7]AWY10167.1 RNA polymerase sigma factor [Vibrio phage VP-1]QDB73355.1 hypothetical protein [Vibrio phage VAP7]UFD98153.1 hypothetical protein [Vibrio phage BX-1]
MALHYVNRGQPDPKDFYFSDDDNTRVCEELKIWRPKRIEARELNLPMSHAPIPEFTAVSIQQIVRHLGTRYNYNGYWFRDEMVDEAVLNALQYLHSFDPNQVGPRSGRVNFHSWVTTSAERVFSNRIKLEEEQVYHKLKSIELNGGLEAFDSDDHDTSLSINNVDNSEIGQDYMARIYAFEEKRKEEKAKQKARRLERQAKKAKPPRNKLARLLKKKKES